MRAREMLQIYKDVKPITDIEFKKMLDQQYFCPEVVNDLLRAVNIEKEDVNFKMTIVLMNAIQLGIIIGKRNERVRRKQGLFPPVSNVERKKERISKSFSMWKNMDEWDLLEVITELKSMTKENEWYLLKENLLDNARVIYSKNFVNRERR